MAILPRWKMDVSIMPRRRAVAKVNEYMSVVYGVPVGENECYVLAALNMIDSGDIMPIFVCEFMDGRVINIFTEDVRFVDIDD